MMSLKPFLLLIVLLSVFILDRRVLSLKIDVSKLQKLNISSRFTGKFNDEIIDYSQEEDYEDTTQLIKDPIYVHNTRKGYYYVKACYMIDFEYVDTPEGKKNNIRDRLYTALDTQVDFLDWTFRSQDFDSDSVPDNIGIKLSETIRLQYVNLYSYEKPNKLEFAQHLEEMFDLDCGVKLVISKLKGQTFVNPYSLPQTDSKGCSACKNKNSSVMAIVDPDELLLETDAKTRRNKATLLFKHIRTLMNSLVHNDKKIPSGCFSGPTNSRNFSVKSNFSRSIETLKFIDCVISKNLDGNCIQTISARNCLKFEPEFSYCGNGIVDTYEECDCGSFMNCWRQNKCSCGPRNGHKPCAKLDKKDRQICHLIAHFQIHNHYEILNHYNHFLFDTIRNSTDEEYHTNFTMFAKMRNSVSPITSIQISKHIIIYLILLMFIN